MQSTETDAQLFMPVGSQFYILKFQKVSVDFPRVIFSLIGVWATIPAPPSISPLSPAVFFLFFFLTPGAVAAEMGTGESGLAEGGVEIVVRGLSVLELLLSMVFTSAEGGRGRGREGGRGEGEEGREIEGERNFHKGKTADIHKC